jgi:hypothetical protein
VFGIHRSAYYVGFKAPGRGLSADRDRSRLLVRVGGARQLPAGQPDWCADLVILEECWRPAFAGYPHVRFTGLKRDLERYVDDYNFERAHHGGVTRGRIPADIVYGAQKLRAR